MNKSMICYLIKSFIKKCVILLMLILLVLLVLRLLGVPEASADTIGQEVQTQVNKRTDLFIKSINNFPAVEKQLLDQNQANINAMGDGRTTSPQGLSFLTKKSKSELESESAQLSTIHENDLNNRGRNEVIKNNAINELYPNYSSPLNKQHVEDAKLIAEGQNKLLDNLFAVLKEKAGIDCKTIKGDKKHEPEYYLQIKNTIHKDTVYTQVFCEELRNQYSCTDSVTLKCLKNGMKWNEWQDKEVDIPGPTVYTQAKNLGKPIKWKRKRYGWHLRFELQKEWRAYLSKYLNIPLEQIAEGITFPSGNWGGSVGEPPFHIGEHYRLVYPHYRFGYKYRDGVKICEQWQESLDEKCRLQ